MGELFHIPKIKSENKQPSKVMNRDQVIDFFGISKSTFYVESLRKKVNKELLKLLNANLACSLNFKFLVIN